jgi:hypothetical protein
MRNKPRKRDKVENASLQPQSRMLAKVQRRTALNHLSAESSEVPGGLQRKARRKTGDRNNDLNVMRSRCLPTEKANQRPARQLTFQAQFPSRSEMQE